MGQVRHQKPRIVLARAAEITEHLGLHDDAPLAVPPELEGLRAAFAHPLDDPEEARRILMRLLDGERIVFQPLAKGKGCEISGYARPATRDAVREFGGGPNGIQTRV
jgi:hypothetical protein